MRNTNSWTDLAKPVPKQKVLDRCGQLAVLQVPNIQLQKKLKSDQASMFTSK